MQDLRAENVDVVLLDPPPLVDIGPFPPGDVFGGAPPSEAAFGGAAGVMQGASFKPDELARIRGLIHEQLISNAQAISPAAAALIADTPLDDYHRIGEGTSHAKLLSKLGRILSADAVAEMRGMSFFDYAREAFGPFELSDEENIGHEQICFRIVRPHRREDVGALHRDAWFWEHYGFKVPAGRSRAKVWVPVYGTPSQAGLLVAPGSHRMPSGFRTTIADGKLSFLPEIDNNELQLGRFCGSPGDPVMFNYGTLHVGSMNRGEQSRVSFEITILFETKHA
jgi:hypothetical protein